jgi:Zn-dependent M28 family amino/carboxypeptidase
LREWVEKISVPRHFRAQREANLSLSHWLAEQFRQWGYEVQLQGPCRNVLALPRHRSSELTLIGAHYDSVPETPGADDNASAVAALLGCAEAISRLKPQTSVAFIAFNCEEDDLLGSTDFVETHLPTAGYRIQRAHILEMVGFANYSPGSQRLPTGLPIKLPNTGDFLGLLANQCSGPAMDAVLSRAKTYLPEFKVMGLEVPLGAEKLFPVLGRSDHLPLWKRGIPAVMWTDTAEFRNPHYHQPTDTPDTLDYGFLLLVTQLLVAATSTELATKS